MSEYVRNRLALIDKSDEFLRHLAIIFGWFENLNLVVGGIYLHEREVRMLWGRPEHFDREVSRVVIDADNQPGILMGYLWGAQVRQSTAVLEGHLALVPGGMMLRNLGPEACFPIGYGAGVKT